MPLFPGMPKLPGLEHLTLDEAQADADAKWEDGQGDTIRDGYNATTSGRETRNNEVLRFLHHKTQTHPNKGLHEWNITELAKEFRAWLPTAYPHHNK